MLKRVSLVTAESEFPALVSDVAQTGQRYVIENGGKPVAALVSMDDLLRFQPDAARGPERHGALAFVGAWGDLLTDAEIDAFIADIYAAREQDRGRPVDLEE